MDPDAASESSANASSNLCRIDVSTNDPMDLFKEWFEEAKDAGMLFANRMCVSSSSSSGEVTARSLLMRQLDDDGFVMMTDARSLKSKQWEENPRAAITFFWGYRKGERIVSRQVRAEGPIITPSTSDYLHLFEREPVYCKIRAHVCHQSQRVEWEELKAAHDSLLQNYKDGVVTLPKPDHVVFYKLIPNKIEYYSANDISIGDRVLFEREDGVSDWKGSWRHHHIAA